MDLSELKALDIKSLTEKEGLGELKFLISTKKLEYLRDLFIELYELDFQNLLIPEEIQKIEDKLNNFRNFIQRLQTFSLSEPNPRQMHDEIENQIESLSQTTIRDLRALLVFLRQEASLRNEDNKNLQEQQKAAIQAEKEYKSLYEKLNVELEDLQNRKSEIMSEKGRIGAIYFGKEFEAQASIYEDRAVTWLRKRELFLTILEIVIGINFLFYLILFFTSRANVWPHISPHDFFTIDYGIIKISGLLLLSYIVGFATKNYNINSGLSVINNHKKNIAETVTSFIGTTEKENFQNEIIKGATQALFEQPPTGYLSKGENKDNGGPFYETINNFINKKTD